MRTTYLRSRLAAELETAGLNLFRDPPTLTGDPFWRDRVATQLAASDATIVLWSSAAQASPWVDQEIRAYSGPILFILMDETPLRQYDTNPAVLPRQENRCAQCRAISLSGKTYVL